MNRYKKPFLDVLVIYFKLSISYIRHVPYCETDSRMKCVSEKAPGLAVGESMERDSLLPPALSESLHIPPPPALPELQARCEPCVLNTTTHRIDLRINFPFEISSLH